jgi:hypothetical protein
MSDSQPGIKLAGSAAVPAPILAGTVVEIPTATCRHDAKKER